MKKRLLISYLLILVIFCNILSFKNIKASASVNIMITKTEYNTETACWEFTIKSNNNKNIYYTYKDNEELSRNCKYVKCGEKISIPSSLIKNSYNVLKLATYTKKSANKMYFNVYNIARNTYNNDLMKFCSKLVNENDSEYNKAKKLYTFIGENKLYEFDGLTNNEYGAYYGGTSACSGFARLYIDMCKIVGLKADYMSEEISGYKYTSWHAWVHLYLDGNIYLVDPTWSGVCFDNEVDYSHFCNNSVVNYIVTDKYDLSSKNIYE